MQTLTHITVGANPAGRPRARHGVRFVLPFSALLLVAACSESEVSYYRAPKEVAAVVPTAVAATTGADPHAGLPAGAIPAPAGAAMAGSPVTTSAGPGLAWTAPAHWQAVAATAMRKGTYVIKGAGESEAQLSITAFPGDVGGEIANVNRWRGQAQLSPLPDGEVAATVTRIEANGLKLAVVDLANPAGGSRLTGAMVPYEGATWFFKLLGPDAIVAKEKPAFLEFLKTIKPASAPVLP